MLAPFQREIIEPLFGEQIKDPDTGEWVRRYSLAWVEMARKNGKSELLAGIALLLTGADDEEGAEVYGVAKDTDQAAARVRRRAPDGRALPARCPGTFKVYPTNRRIVYPKTGSFYRVIAADALGNLGQDPHGILFDEVIAQPNGELWDALKTGFGTRRQPLMVAATTAGDDMADFAREEHKFSLQVAKDPSLAPRRFVYIRNLPKDADWRDESRWAEPNPALGIFLRPQVLRDELTSAMNHPREERRFRMFRLNQWQSGGLEGWSGAENWHDAGNVGIVDETKLKGKRCWGGIVAASATDLAAVCWVFANPEGAGVWALWRYFIPAGRLEELNRRTSGPACGLGQGWWTAHGHRRGRDRHRRDRGAGEGRRRHVRRQGDRALRRQRARHRPAADRREASGHLDRCEHAGLVPRGLGADARCGEFNHGGNPITAWQVAHLQTRETIGGTPRIDMKGSPENVYGAVAAELALRRFLVAAPKPKSAYSDDHGLMTV